MLSSMTSDNANARARESEARPGSRRWRVYAGSLYGYSLTGGSALLLLTLVEMIDVNSRGSVPFESLAERFRLLSYGGLNVLTGLLIGMLIGLLVIAASLLTKGAARVVTAADRPRMRHRLLIALNIWALLAFALNQEPHVNRYIIGVLREGEKIDSVRNTLLNHERAYAYAVVLAIVFGCWAVLRLTRAIGHRDRAMRITWRVSLAVLIAVAYYVDSRIEVQLYEDSLHLSAYLFSLTVTMALVGSFNVDSRSVFSPTRNKQWRVMGAIGAVVALSSSFTVFDFGRNQSLKVLVFYHTTQTKESAKVAWWMLDRDGDGYPALMGGGDADDSRSDINPSQIEIIGDGVDNNCIGGDLSAEDVEEWKRTERRVSGASLSAPRRFNVVYIFIDALRADHLGTYGYSRDVSPKIDRLAARSTVFDNAFTPAPNTFEALPKFMQSSYWDGHFETWTETLARNGYNALLFPRRISTLRRHVKGMTEAYQGTQGRLDYTIDRAIEILSAAPATQPFCAYLYASDPHRPYREHQDFNFGSQLADRYDGEIAYADSQFGRLFEWMESSGRMSDTAVVIMADHGESLGERGIFKHSSQLYNEQTHVPMIIYLPGAKPRRVPDYVSTIDLGTTILDIAGLEPSSGSIGVSLLPFMNGESVDHPPVYGEQTNKQESPYVRPERNVHIETKKYMVITQSGFKLIYDRNISTFELYDLKNDPAESHNLFDRMPERAAELKRLLGRYIDVVTASRPFDADENRYIFGEPGQGVDDE